MKQSKSENTLQKIHNVKNWSNWIKMHHHRRHHY